MRANIIRTALIAAICCAAHAQTFEVATVKPSAPATPNGRGLYFFRGNSGGPGTKDPGRIDYPSQSLKNLLVTAYDVKNYQITGPGWLDTERFDITATLPPNTTKEQFRVMMQNLLNERFKLEVHRETKELPSYSLVVNKGGPKLKESAPAEAQAEPDRPFQPPPPGPPKIGPDGFPEMPGMASRPGLFMMMMPGRARLMAREQTMADLATRLTGQLNRPVIDNTGLTAKYDFTLTYTPEGMNGPGGPMGPMPGGPGGGFATVAVVPRPGGGADSVVAQDGEAPLTLFGAIQAQLGLKLEPKKGNVEIIVVDRMEKTPTEN